MIHALVNKIRTTTSSQNKVVRFGKQNSDAANLAKLGTPTLTFRAVAMPWLPALFSKGTPSEEKRRNKQRISAVFATVSIAWMMRSLFTEQFDLGLRLYIIALYSVFIGICIMMSPKPKFEMSLNGFRKRVHSNRFMNGYLSFCFRVPGSREWSELRSVRFQKGDLLPALSSGTVLDAADSIVFDWESRKGWNGLLYYSTDYINLAVLNPEEREQFFQILSSCVPQELLSPEALFLQLQSLSGASLDENCEYTDIWLQEFNRRFEISNYVALSPGDKCGNGRFTITMLIRTKINSSTYLAIDEDRKKIIVKELVAPADCEDSIQRKMLEQFNREAALLSRLVHPSIVDIRDHFIENDRTYIVMDCIAGKNMREHIRVAGPMPEREALVVAKQLISVLQYLHHCEPPILHRDFTPDNLAYLPADQSVVVLDFGAANVFTAGKTVTLVGKQSYMPPEQFKGKAEPASDVYAFGATLAFMLSGKVMPSMGKPPDLDEKSVSPQLIKLIQQCTDFDSFNRPGVDQVAQELESLGERKALTGRVSES
jgi:tRNA A-37 threonylcarbamoyl transferase component Bud32